MFLLLINFMLFGFTFIIGKMALDYVVPIFFIGFRELVAGLIIFGFLYFFQRRKLYLVKRDLLTLLVISFFHVYLSFTLGFWALQYVKSSKACFLFNLGPFMTALFAYLWLGERLSRAKWIGLIIGFVGFFPILFANGSAEESVGSLFIFTFPEIGLLMSAASAAFAWILIKRLIKSRNYSAMMINGFAMTVGGAGALVTSLFVEPFPYFKFPDEGSTLPYIGHLFNGGAKFFPLMFYTGLLILISNIIFYNVYALLLKKYSATFLSFVGITTPLFTAFFGWLILGEVISWPFYISIIIVGCGLYIFYKGELQWQKQRQQNI